MIHTIEIEDDLLILMIDATIKKLKCDIDNDNGKNKIHSENLKKRLHQIQELLDSIQK